MLRNQDFESGVQIRRTPFNRIQWCVNFPCRFFHLTGSRLQNIKILFDLWFWFVYLSRSNYLSSARAILFINERLSTRPGPKCCPEQVPRTDWPQSSAGNLRVCVCVRSVYPGDVSCFIGLENEIAFPGKILLHDSIIEKRTNVRNRNRPRVIIFGKCWQQQQPTYLRCVCMFERVWVCVIGIS